MNVKYKLLYTILINITLVLIAFVTSLIISNILGPEGFGVYKYIILVATTLTLLANMGLPDMLIVKLSKKEINLKEYLLGVLTGVAPIYIILGSVLFYYLFGKENLQDKPLVIIALLYCLIYQINSICQQSILALDKLIKFQLFEISKQAIVLCLSITLYYFFTINIFNLFSSLLIANFIAIGYVTYLLLKDKTRGKLKLPFSKDLIKNSLRFYAFNTMNFFTSRIDIYILKWSFTESFYMIGIYSLALTLAEKLWIVPEAIRSVLFLELSNKRKGDDFVASLLRLLTFFMVIVGIIVGFCSIVIIPLLFPKFYESVVPFLLLLPGALFYCYSKMLGVYFTINEMLMVNTYSSVIVLSINIILNILLIPKYNILGASMAKSVAFIIGASYHFYKFSRVSKIQFQDLLLIKQNDFITIKSMIKNRKTS